MIDPTNITNYNLTTEQLQEHIIWWALAAGKDGVYEAKCTEQIMLELEERTGYEPRRPFEMLRRFNTLTEITQLFARHKTGAQSIKAQTVLGLIESNIDLKTCTREDLLKLWGMGMKTATCFILHSRPNQQMAGIDTHYLKFLRDRNIVVPKQRPSKPKDGTMHKEYLRLELEGVKVAQEWGCSCAELDLTVWNCYRNKRKLVSKVDYETENNLRNST